MSGGSNKAAKEAQANTEAQQAAAQKSQAAINAIFDNPLRTEQYGQLGKDTTAYYTDQLNTQKAENDRKLKFALARGGQVGGSLQTDQFAQAGKDYNQGLLGAERKGMAAASGLQSQDEQARANLIAQAQGGLDATSAASNAASLMRANLTGAQASAQSDALGNAFGGFADLYQRSQDAAALRAGRNQGLGYIYQPGFGAAPGGQ